MQRQLANQDLAQKGPLKRRWAHVGGCKEHVLLCDYRPHEVLQHIETETGE